MSGATCRHCGETWPRDPAQAVPCPVCHAQAGGPCRRPSGHERPVHHERDQAALDAGALAPCPAAPELRPDTDQPDQIRMPETARRVIPAGPIRRPMRRPALASERSERNLWNAEAYDARQARAASQGELLP